MRRGLEPHRLLAPIIDFRRVGLAVSGGADSLALMLLASRVSGPDFVVYTVDHGLRSEAADEAAFVVREAGRLGIPARTLRWDGPRPRSGLQQAARQARYRLIGAAMREDGAEVLATAHHLQDQAETVLMRLAYGSGLAGLRGMDLFSEVEGVTVVRPLLGTDPAALRAVVDDAGVLPVADPSNLDEDFERVRWRALMPQLAELGLTAERLAQFAGRARDADRVLAMQAAIRATSPDHEGWRTPRDVLRAMPRPVAVRIIQRALEAVGGAKRPHALGPVERLTDRLLREPVRTTLHGCLITSDGVAIRVEPEPLTGARARRRAVLAADSAG